MYGKLFDCLFETKLQVRYFFQPKNIDIFLVSIVVFGRSASVRHFYICFCGEIRNILFGYYVVWSYVISPDKAPFLNQIKAPQA